jgi:ABC-type glycerol-3-phosphate transport system substrate-binding protein
MKRLLCICLVICFTCCGCKEQLKTENTTEEKEVTTLTLATFEENSELMEQVVAFNEKNSAYQIEVKLYTYYEQTIGDGVDKLKREVVSGNGPDIINFGSTYSISDILGEYTEDLVPYLKGENEEFDSLYYSNILEAFSYQNKLYALPISFTLETFATRKSFVGDCESWTLEELMACYQTLSETVEDEFYLYPGETKLDVFGMMVYSNVNDFVDWNTGTCSFDEEKFQELLLFANTFPGELSITEDFSPMGIFSSGKALLYPAQFTSVYDITKCDLILQDEANYIGYPTNLKDGTRIRGSNLMLAISIDCKEKRIAWDFISRFLTEDYQGNMDTGFPILQSAFEKQLQEALKEDFITASDGKNTKVKKAQVVFEGETVIPIYSITKQQSETLLHLVKKSSISSARDSKLHEIILEEVQGYFHGEKTLDETVNIIQRRAETYVNEKR